MRNPCDAHEATLFVLKYGGDAAALARLALVPAENILGLAAHESLYGGGRIAQEDNNYFSMHAPAPLQIGEDAARGNPKLKVAKFASFYQCGQSFLARFGSAVRGKTDPLDFANALVLHGFNSGKAANGGRDNYAKLIAETIKMVRLRMKCPA